MAPRLAPSMGITALAANDSESTAIWVRSAVAFDLVPEAQVHIAECKTREDSD
jgi:hypothetical protein